MPDTITIYLCGGCSVLLPQADYGNSASCFNCGFEPSPKRMHLEAEMSITDFNLLTRILIEQGVI